MLPSDIKLFSVDDHIIEPPDVWQSRLPQKYRAAGPKVVELDNGREAWDYEGRLYSIPLGMVRTLPEIGREVPYDVVRFDEMRPGAYEPFARLQDMDIDGVWRSIAFPTFGRFAGHRFVEGEDKTLARLCVQAYNDFLSDEWCAADPDRLLPMMALPMWDVEASVAEVERTRARGARAFAFSENPSKLGLPSLHTRDWDPLWAAIQDSGIPICIHIGSSGELITSSADAPWSATLALNGLNAMVTCVDWIYSGLFERFPGLKLVLSEGGAGWIPYILERADKTFEIHGAKSGTTRPPTEVFREHIYCCMVTDFYAVRNLDLIGADRLLWESDYPHNDSMWPDSRTVLEQAMADVPDDVARKIGHDNAIAVFG